MKYANKLHKSPILKKKDIKEITPVKLASYMASRQASKGRDVIKDLRATQFVSKLELVGMQVQVKRKNVIQLMQKLIEQLIKKKIALETTMMEELYQQERIIHGMLQMISYSSTISGLSDFSVKDKPIRRSRFTTQRPLANHVIFQQLNQNQNSTISNNNFKIKITNSENKSIRPLSQRIANNQNQYNFDKQTIYRNTSISNVGLSLPFDSNVQSKRLSNRYSRLQLKLESRVKFKQNKF